MLASTEVGEKSERRMIHHYCPLLVIVERCKVSQLYTNCHSVARIFSECSTNFADYCHQYSNT